MNKCACLAVMALFGFYASGCATIVHGTSTRLNIDSDPEGAMVRVGNKTVVTPAMVIVRNNTQSPVEFTKKGYNSYVIYLEQQMSGWIWGNLLSFGVLGMVIDVASGAAYRLDPKDIKVVLEKKEGSNP